MFKLTPKRSWIPVVAALLTSAAAQAQDNGIFVGVSAGDVSSDHDWPVPVQEESVSDESAFKVVAGVRPLDSFAIEIDYTDFGRTSAEPELSACVPLFSCPEEQSLEARALSVSAVGYYSLPLVDLFGRIGVARWEADLETVLPGIGISERSDEGSDPTYGVGLQFRLGSFAVRAEYEEFDVSGGSAELASIGFTYTFL